VHAIPISDKDSGTSPIILPSLPYATSFHKTSFEVIVASFVFYPPLIGFTIIFYSSFIYNSK
jgi:hypothetical protein